MKKLSYILLISGIAGFTSCKKDIDVNRDPNAATNAPMNLVLPAAQASIAIHVGGELYNLGGFWAQYYTQSPDAGQYENIDSWNVESDFFDRTWSEFYGGALKDLDYIKRIAMDEGSNAYYLVATCMEAYAYQVLVDLYGQVPYSEALQDLQNMEPAYDEGRDIYAAMIENIDEALAMYNADPSLIAPDAASDLIFGGDMDNWVRFANTLKFKMYMRGSETSFGDPSEILALANGGNLLDVHATMTQFESAANRRNPFYDVNISSAGLNDVNHAASQTIVSYLDDSDDARLSELFEPGDGGDFLTKPQGDFENRDISFDDLAKPIFSSTMPVYLFSVPEIKFLQAEALERFGGGGQSYYEEGIEESFAMYGMEDTASTYYGAGGVYAYNMGGSTEDRVKQIMTQKWVAMTSIQNLEAFFEINRTDYPEYEPLSDAQPGDLIYSLASVLPQGQSPRRLLFPDASKSRNSNVPPQPPGGISAPVWWDN